MNEWDNVRFSYTLDLGLFNILVHKRTSWTLTVCILRSYFTHWHLTRKLQNALKSMVSHTRVWHTLTDDYHTLHYCCTDKCCLPQGKHTHTHLRAHTFTDKCLAPEGLPIQSNPTNTLNFHFKQKANPHTDTTKSLALLPLFSLALLLFLAFSFPFPSSSTTCSSCFIATIFFCGRMKCKKRKMSMTAEGDC